METIAMTVGDVVAANPAHPAILEHFGIDYCCGGKNTLADACAAKGIDPAVLIARLAEVSTAAAPAKDPAKLSEEQLIDEIERTHHAYLRTELPRLNTLLDKVIAAHGGRHGELERLRSVFRALGDELLQHLQKEEIILFPAIRRLAAGDNEPFHCGSIGGPISVMEMEHQDAGEALRRMRELTGDYTPPADGCASYRALFAGLLALEADLHQHIHKENNLLFPRAQVLERKLSSQSA